jgi:asparagine synthase (glutamine-hydrolysing)
MCGIVGVFDYRGTGHAIDRQVFDGMVDALAHRGPNGRGVWFDLGLALGHRRLAILDPTPAGKQPMVDAARSMAVTYNGEIYNYRELRRELEAAGYAFHTDCDTEVLLASYAHWGTAAVEKLNGIFAFALWDGVRRRLWLVRDRLGVKPLYYSIQGGVMRFASEVKALLADPAFVRRPAAAAIKAFLAFGFIPAPQTGFDQVQQLPPGRQLLVQDGEIVESVYWRLSMRQVPRRAAEAQEEFAHRFALAVRRQMVSDVPLGAFLSGGVDSAAVVAEMVSAMPQRVRTFSVGFDEASFDERNAALVSAERLGTEHQAIHVSLDVEDTFDRFMAGCDEPFADSSSLAVHHLCRVASQEVTVALSGDGADELLAGYPTYSATHLAAAYRRFPAWSRSFARRVAAAIPVSEKRYNLHQFANRFVLGAEEGEGRDFSSWRLHFRSCDRATLCRPEAIHNGRDPLELYAVHYHHAPEAASSLKQMLHADLTFYLPNDMLVKVDRMSMAHGLEVRVPFLDHELVEFCATLPDEHLARLPFPRKNKLILRRRLERQIGKDVAWRKKTGFNVPVEHAMRNGLGQRLQDEAAARPFRDDGPFHVDRLLDFARQHEERRRDAGHALFSALVLAAWWNRWLS